MTRAAFRYCSWAMERSSAGRSPHAQHCLYRLEPNLKELNLCFPGAFLTSIISWPAIKAWLRTQQQCVGEDLDARSKGAILEDGKSYLGYAAAEAATLSPQGFVAAASHDLGKQILGLCHTHHTAMDQFQAEKGTEVVFALQVINQMHHFWASTKIRTKKENLIWFVH